MIMIIIIEYSVWWMQYVVTIFVTTMGAKHRGKNFIVRK